MEGFLNNANELMDDFMKCGEIMNTVDISVLPIELQLKLGLEITQLMDAIKHYNNEVKPIMVMASMLSGGK